MKQIENKKVICFIVLSAFIFSTMEVALKIGGGTFDPLQITLLRFVIGGVVLFPMALSDLRRRQVRLLKSDYNYMTVLGILCICVSMLFFQIGVMNSNASTAAVIFSVNPMFTMIFAHFLTEEKMNRRKALALLVSFAGIVVMINPLSMVKGNTVVGMICIILGAMSFGLYSAVGKLRIGTLGGMAQTSISFILGSIGLFVIMLFMGRPILKDISFSTVPILLYIGIVVTGIGYLLYFKAIEYGGAAKGSVVFFVKPVIAPVVAQAVLGEVITVQTVAGVGILLIGSYINMTDAASAEVVDVGEEKEGNGQGHENNGAG